MGISLSRVVIRTARKALTLSAASVMAFSGLALAAPMFSRHAGASAPTIVQPNNYGSWSVADTRTGGSVNFINDTTAPSGSGALELTTDSTNAAKAQYMHSASIPLSDITSLGYSTKQISGAPTAAPSFQLIISDLSGTGSTWTTLVYEPYWNGTVAQDQWQTWDVSSGQFWSSKTGGYLTAGAGGAPFYTLASVKADNPDAMVIGFGVNIGTYNPSYDVETDALNFNGEVYDFEAGPIPSAVYVGNYSTLDSDGHFYGYDAFNTIQSGIDNVADDGTVHVADGNYTGDLVINQPVSIIGPNANLSGSSLTRGTEAKVTGQISVYSGGVTIKGLEITNPNWNGATIRGIHVYNTGTPMTDIDISNNIIDGIHNANSKAGAYGIMVQAAVNGVSISGNLISDIYSAGWAHGLEVTPSNGDSAVPQNITITGNTISNVSNASDTDQYAFSLDASDYETADASQITFSKNSILGSIRNLDAAHTLIASYNYWGGAVPDFSTLVSGDVSYLPFYTDSSLTTLSQSSTSANNIGSLIGSGTGSVLQLSTDQKTITVQQATTISVPGSGSHQSSVVLPTGTQITQTNGNAIDSSKITASTPNTGSFTNLGSSKVVKGALQWGVPGIHLSFSQPITLSIYVGTDLDGQTLNIVHSATGSSGWTSSGIVSPATCVVSGGYCTFQATEASYYAATETVSQPKSGGSSTTSSPSSSNAETPSAASGTASSTSSAGQVKGASTTVNNGKTSSLATTVPATASLSQPKLAAKEANGGGLRWYWYVLIAVAALALAGATAYRYAEGTDES